MTLSEFREEFEQNFHAIECFSVTERNHALELLRDMGYKLGVLQIGYLTNAGERNPEYLCPILHDYQKKEIACRMGGGISPINYTEFVSMVYGEENESFDEDAMQTELLKVLSCR